MSVAFTDIDTQIASEYGLQDVDFANELFGGFNERNHSAKDTFLENIGVASEGVSIQEFSGFIEPEQVGFRVMQEYLETLAEDFIQTSYGASGLDGLPTTTNYTYLLDIPQFRIDASIPDGYRRAQSFDDSSDDWGTYADAMFSYGDIQECDIVGPWIWVDLQRALNIMTDATRLGYNDNYQTADVTVTAEATCAAMWSAL